MSVRVAVRVRPFNKREKDNNSSCCIEMRDPKTIITNVQDGSTRDFTFDYSYWSHDEFEEQPNGYYEPISSKYADQKRVYNELGKSVLDNAWEGYHCCLFAYGQTGSGKSYSMIGYGANKGIVPMVSDEIFQRINSQITATKSFEVTLSMLEIYNEKVQDLLVAPNSRPQGGLKVRESKVAGVFVDGLKDVGVSSYAHIEKLMEEGNKNKTIGSTLMNATSSRAHTVITLTFTQREELEKRKTQKLSIINLVDLAGSEKAGQTGATGDRLKEGCMINKSLTTLGQVINVLAEKAVGRGKGEVVPYRNSVLTRILSNALGGNSKTIMICALSPASINYDETLSTLRYAERAKKIQNKAIINESAQDKIIRELKQENEKLRKLLEGKDFSAISGDASQKILELQEELAANKRLMGEKEKTFSEKVEEGSLISIASKINREAPHIFNINEDPQLSGKIAYDFDKGTIMVGRKNAPNPADIVLGDVGIQPNHAVFRKVGDETVLEVCNQEASENTYVNGEKLVKPKKLIHNDRIVFGTGCVYIYKQPGMENESSTPDEHIDYEFVQKEKRDKADAEQAERLREEEEKFKEEAQKQKKEMEEKMEMERIKNEEEMKKKQELYEKQIQELKERMEQEKGAAEIEKAKADAEKAEKEYKLTMLKMQEEQKRKEEEEKRKYQEEQKLREFKQQQKARLDEQLTRYLPLVREANIIAKELKRKIKFDLKIVTVMPDGMGNPLEQIKRSKNAIEIKVTNNEEGYSYMWDEDKFNNRLYLLRDLVNDYFDTEKLPVFSTKEEDPFWDPPEPQLIGTAFYNLKTLSYLFDSPAEMAILNTAQEGQCGTLSLNAIPTDAEGDLENIEDIEEPEEIVGKPLYFKFKIDKATGLPSDFCSNVYCTYRFYLDEEMNQTEICQGKNKNPIFNYVKSHNVEMVTESLLKYLTEGTIAVKVWGYTDAFIKSGTIKAQQKPEIEEEKKVGGFQGKEEVKLQPPKPIPKQEEAKPEAKLEKKIDAKPEESNENKETDAKDGKGSLHKRQKVANTGGSSTCCIIF